MAQGSIKKRRLSDGSTRYDVVIDLGSDPATDRRRQRKKTFTSKREAQAALATWLADIERGVAVDRSRQTVADTLRYWLDTYARPNLRPRTVASYAEVIDHHLIPGLGGIRLQSLTASQVQAFYSMLLANGVGLWTVHYCHMRLSQTLKQAVRLSLITRNVCDMVDPPRLQPREMHTWDAHQARRFLAVAAESGYGPIWPLAAAGGMRRGELLGLRWGDVDLDHGLVHVRQTVVRVGTGLIFSQPKSAAGRRAVHIPPLIVQLLREHRVHQNQQRLQLGAVWQDHDLVFAAANGEPINPSNLRRDFLSLIARAGVPTIRVHDLRHTFATLALSSGAPLKAVAEAIGHADTRLTLSTYTHVLPGQRQEVADKVASLLFVQQDVDTVSPLNAPDTQ